MIWMSSVYHLSICRLLMITLHLYKLDVIQSARVSVAGEAVKLHLVYGGRVATESFHGRRCTWTIDAILIGRPQSFHIILTPIPLIHMNFWSAPIQICRTIRGLGYVNQASTRARATQLSLRIFLHICRFTNLPFPSLFQSCVNQDGVLTQHNEFSYVFAIFA